ncbi:DUF2059 domain-containing protein [Flavobacterium chuncheonense]|uniref:DUF2059 domain-containing protein n=1 Tax=Flavobacterium chuncheonense TaxID=2026653 RepID=A0ABW5YLT2_9FLAO
MKKFILTVAFVVVAQLGMAQDAFKSDALKVIEKSGAAGPMQNVKEQVLASIPEAKHADFSKDFDATLPALYDKMAVIYMETYTHDELKEMLKFYDSPVGKKIAANAGELMKKSTEAGQEWGMQLQGLMMKYMQ